MFSSLQSTKKYFLITFLISCILLEVFTLVIYNQSKISKNYNDWLIHSYEVLRIGRMALVDSIDLTNAEQEYVQTGYTNYYDDYKTALTKLNVKLDALTKAVKDNPGQEQNAVALIDKAEQLKAITSNAIDAVHNNHTSVYSIRANMLATKQALAEVRTAADVFGRNEASLLDQRSQSAEGGQNNYLWTLFLGAILGLCTLIIANTFIFLLINKSSLAENNLRKSEELFAATINGLNDGVFDYDVRKDTIYYSPSYQAMLGYSPEELKRISQEHDRFYEHMHPDDIVESKELLRQFIEGEIREYYRTFRVRHQDGRWVWIMSRGVAIRDENGRAIRMIGAHTNISVQKQREEELNYFIQENELQRHELAMEKERAEIANVAKSDFLATMSHEIRTPMNAVIGLARLLLETKLDEKQHKMVDTLYVNADVLLRLVNDLLDISRIESGQVELEEREFTVESVIRSLHAMLDGPATAKGLTLSMTDKLTDYIYLGDPTRIQQILANLIGNAIKFTSHGKIDLVAEPVSVDGDKSEVCITVSDTGVGIPQNKLDVVFDKFVQADQTISRRFGGSGLGLAICKSLAKMMGGDISVSSKQNEGSVFTLRLPLKIAQKKKAVTTPIASAKTPASSGNVLIVEDYAPNIMVATLMLEHLGYTADIAKNGKEALQRVRDAQAPYLAVLMDVQMQDMDGYETTKRLRALEKEKGMRHFIIGVTAHALAGDRQRCLDAGMDDYMSKPIHPDLLAHKLSGLAKAA